MIMIMIYTNHKCKSLKEAFLKKKKEKKSGPHYEKV